jgi:hypothetical protein
MYSDDFVTFPSHPYCDHSQNTTGMLPAAMLQAGITDFLPVQDVSGY